MGMPAASATANGAAERTPDPPAKWRIFGRAKRHHPPCARL